MWACEDHSYPTHPSPTDLLSLFVNIYSSVFIKGVDLAALPSLSNSISLLWHSPCPVFIMDLPTIYSSTYLWIAALSLSYHLHILVHPRWFLTPSSEMPLYVSFLMLLFTQSQLSLFSPGFYQSGSSVICQMQWSHLEPRLGSSVGLI